MAKFRADIILLVTAIIWGLAFVAQRMGMDHVGPFTFNGVRFILGGISLLPLYYFQRNKFTKSPDRKGFIWGGIIAGIALFLGATLQQVGLQWTTAGKAGFITGLYVIFVPIIGLFSRQKTGAGIWIGALIAIVGMYLLSVNENFTIEKGDLLELVGAFFFAIHVLVIARISPKYNALAISTLQFFTTGLLSFVFAFITEEVLIANIMQAAVPILYGGIMSVGIAYTLQVVAQKDAHPAHAAIILSLEAVFAVLGGWLLLNENLSMRGLSGCGLMLAGMLLAQLQSYIFGDKKLKLKLQKKG